jgi:uncharacterized protein (TIGR03083 family)
VNKDTLLDRLRIGRGQWEAAIERLSPEELTRPSLFDGWSVKDLVAHVGAWERTAATVISALLDGHSPDLDFDAIPLDELNARFFAEQHTQALDDVIAAERVAYQALLDLVETAADADLFGPQRFAWTHGAPLVDWVAANSYEHYGEHIADMTAWLDR